MLVKGATGVTGCGMHRDNIDSLVSSCTLICGAPHGFSDIVYGWEADADKPTYLYIRNSSDKFTFVVLSQSLFGV